MSNHPIKIGLMPPLTGLVELYGPEICYAAEIAVADINQQGGVIGRPLELVIEDDGSMPETAIAAAKKLVEHHRCDAIIGNLLSNSRIAVASRIAEPNRVPYLNFSFYEGSISGRYFFSYSALPNQQISAMIPYMVRHYGHKIYFAGNNYEWPRGSIDAAKEVLQQLGGEVVGEEYLNIGVSAFEIEQLLSGVARSGADIFVPYFAGSDQITLLKRFVERGLKEKMAVVMGHYDEAMVRLLPQQVRSGFYSCNSYFMAVETPRNRAYLQQLASHPKVKGLWPEGNGVMTNFGEGTYTCVRAYAQAVAMAGSTESEAVVAALEQGVIDSCQGEVRMDSETHHAWVNSYLARCRNDGTFELIESFGQLPPIIPQRYQQHRALHQPASAAIPSELTTVLPRPGSDSSVELIFGQILDITDMAVIATDEEGRVLQANRGARELFGYTMDEFIGMSVHILLPPNLRDFHQQAFKSFVEGEPMQLRMGERGEITGYRQDGTFFPAQASISKFRNSGRWVMVASMQDISAKKRAEEVLLWRATHDPLTRLANRSLIKTRMQSALDRTETSGHQVGVLFIDLDQFKLVNDTYGHDAGDQLLIRVANILLEQVRAGDIVARLGGDEFVVLCENITHLSVLEALAEQVIRAMRFPFSLGGQELICTASVGVALGTGGQFSADELLRNADAAMYYSKEQGRDAWSLFSEDLTDRARSRLEMINGLRRAVERNEFELAYQPIVVAETGEIKGAEALLRWYPPGGSVSPAQFIPLAEESQLIISIGRWVFERVCQMQARLQQQFGEQAPYLSVNLSKVQLNCDEIVTEFAQILRETGASPRSILLELTETSLFSDVEKNLAVLRGLNRLGMDIAVDDFGTGYSSLLQLLKLPISTIKIDRDFIDGIDKQHDARLVTSAIIKMGKALNKSLIAEGVETKTQWLELCVLQCDAIQGFYFYRPMLADEFLTTLTHQFDKS
ncbi:EAL domain-containing protein [Ectothiorhodospiraceae bacterium BW-2]|nr:EAL domain-containing protein [Ectothiorhodospiraceae bacterium BW-2]